MSAAENLQSFATQNVKAKLIKRIAKLVQQDGLDYAGWRYVAKNLEQLCRRKPTQYTTRRIEQVVAGYAKKAGVVAHPHTFRHQAITYLTRHSGLADAELQLITGHARRETLAIYQHVALDADLEQKYQTAMRNVEL